MGDFPEETLAFPPKRPKIERHLSYETGGAQVQGLAAIAANNGWAMAATGACIVIAGLAVLSAIISQLHKIIGLFEKKEKTPSPAAQSKGKSPETEAIANESELLLDLETTAQIYKAVAASLGDSFPLAALYTTFTAANLPHPHITVRELREAGYLVPAGEGTFSWKSN